MIKQLSKVGNSSAITLDKPLLELVGLKPGGAVEVRVESRTIVLTPVDPSPVSEKDFNTILDRIEREHGEVLQRLAK